LRVLVEIDPSSGAANLNALGRGWSIHASYFCMVEVCSEIRLPAPSDGAECILLLKFAPLLSFPRSSSSHVAISVGSREIGRLFVGNELGHVAFRIPTEAFVGQNQLELTFKLVGPKAVSVEWALCSLRLVQLCAPTLAAKNSVQLDGEKIAATELMQRFVSLGDNCELGLVQRLYKSEPLGLFRFASIGMPTLVTALEAKLSGIGDVKYIDLELVGPDDRPKEYAIKQTRYNMGFHSHRYESEPAELVLKEESRKLQYLARKLLEELGEGQKIFVFKRNHELSEAEILPLFLAMKAFGQNTLLWVVPQDAEHEGGAIEVIGRGLMKGYIARFAPYEKAYDFDPDAWLKLCSNAYRIWRTHFC
jgi:hypothetical protein